MFTLYIWLHFYAELNMPPTCIHFSNAVVYIDIRCWWKCLLASPCTQWTRRRADDWSQSPAQAPRCI